MPKDNKVKKKKLNKKQPEKNQIKKKKKLKVKKRKLGKAVPRKENQIHNVSDSDDDNSSGETDSENFQKLLEPYTKEQLIDFIIDAAVKDAALSTRIRDAADRDVSHRKIFVYGLGWDTTRETLVSAFESYGKIEDCNVITDRVTGKAKGYGFVLFKTGRGASKALKQPKKKINNRFTSCQLASVGRVASAPQSQDTGGRKIYVANVHTDVDPEKLRAFFAKFGEIETGPIGFDMRTGKSRGFALFVYKTQEAARKALQEPYKAFEGHQLHCKLAIEGKKPVGGAASVTTAVHPVPAPALAGMAAMQNMALLGQYPNLDAMYGGLFADPSAGLLAAGSLNPMVAAGPMGLGQGIYGSGQMGQMGAAAAGLGIYGATGSHGLVSLGGSPPVLGSYGSNGATQSSQHAYPGSQIGQTSGKAPGNGGSFGGYPSYT